MLQLAGGIRLGVDIGDLLQLQTALQRQGVVQIPPDEKHLIVPGQLPGGGLNGSGVSQNFLHLLGKRLNALHHGGIGLQIDGAHNVAEVQSQQVQHHHLGAVGLGGGHGDLRACPGVQHVVGLPCDGGANHIDDGEDAGAPLLGFPQCGHGVQRLAGLADDDCQITGADDGIAVPELGGQTPLHAAAQHPLQIVLAHHAHMVAGAAGHNKDAADIPNFPVGHGQVAEHHPALLNTAGDGLGDGGGLLEDLLQHEVGIAALFRRVHVPVDIVPLLFHRAAALVIDADANRGHHGQLAVVHVHHVPGVPQQRCHVGGDEVLPLAVAQQQRRVLPGGNEPIRRVGAQDTQGIGTLHRRQHTGDGLEHVAAVPVVPVQQLGHHLRVRLGAEGIALFQQLLFQLRVVFDDAVVHHGEAAALADLRVGVGVVGLAVGGPAGMADADNAGHGLALVRQVGQRLQTALGLLHTQTVRTAHGHTGGVIAPVFQPAQSLQQQRRGLLRSYISYDSTHSVVPPDTI